MGFINSLFFIFLITASCLAKDIGLILQPKKLIKVDKEYEVLFKGEAGIYTSPKEYIKCLQRSVKGNYKVRVIFDKKLKIKYCLKDPGKK